jgi:MoaA/NifB/PqqE/SkfB family radical SAM enzyme
MKTSSKLRSYFREFKFVAKALLSTDHPVLAHIIPMRRCNLDCSYCNEYDKTSAPVPLEVMARRIDKLAELGTTAVIVSGGEPLLHPDLEKIIARVRRHGMLAALISNCYLMTQKRIRQLNEAGLEYLQVSIDNVNPDEISKKSLRLLDAKLLWLSGLAEFKVNVNSVIGCFRNPDDALVIGRRAVELGFSCSLGVLHDGSGRLKPLVGREREIYTIMRRMGKKGHTRINKFQRNLVEGRPNRWRCRAGARYLYICENGLVHYCSQQRGSPGVPLESYTRADISREYVTEKGCADFCTVGCVHQVSLIDAWRGPQTRPAEGLQQIELNRAS